MMQVSEIYPDISETRALYRDAGICLIWGLFR